MLVFRGFVYVRMYAENLADQTKVAGLNENQWFCSMILDPTKGDFLGLLYPNKHYSERFGVSSKLYGSLPNNRMHTIEFA